MIKEQEGGMPTAEVCRRHGLSPASFYKFKAKYGGMNVSDTVIEVWPEPRHARQSSVAGRLP